MDPKKEREFGLLNEFRDRISCFPPGEVTPSESPDFLVGSQGRFTGIEIVDYVRGDSDDGSMVRKAEIDHDEVAIIAKDIFEESGYVELDVKFIWLDHLNLNKQTRQGLGKAAAEVVRRNVPLNIYENVDLGWDDLEGTPLSGKVHSISIMRLRKGSSWGCTSGAFVTSTVPEIAELIESKNRKAASYRQRCQEVWLLVAADGAYVSSNLDVTQEVLDYEFESVFDRVFLYRRLEQSVQELRARHGTTLALIDGMKYAGRHGNDRCCPTTLHPA